MHRQVESVIYLKCHGHEKNICGSIRFYLAKTFDLNGEILCFYGHIV